jgi:hypothetical protein
MLIYYVLRVAQSVCIFHDTSIMSLQIVMSISVTATFLRTCVPCCALLSSHILKHTTFIKDAVRAQCSLLCIEAHKTKQLQGLQVLTVKSTEFCVVIPRSLEQHNVSE